ncbi:hypothetical protein BX600DRAFT_92204 [Xylariales sp. PMI_506]|nr:hypothetical protein BX600DRAFT_92204 [Xylariales sp. PMI_506]
MTEPVLGSSLLQAQDFDSSSAHSHFHNHNHRHAHSHHEALHKRQDESSETVVHIVETIAVVQFIDASGATVSIVTQTSEPTTTTAVEPAQTSEASFEIESDPSVTSAVGDDVSSLLSDLLSATSSVNTTTTSMPSFPTVESFAQITSTPLSGSPTPYPSYTGVSNSTATNASITLSQNNTATLRTLVATDLTTSTLPFSSGTIVFNDTYTTTLGLSSNSFSSVTEAATSTATGDVGGVNGSGDGTGAGGATGTSPSSSTSTAASSSSTPASAGTVAGSVIGAVAGLAFIVVAVLMLLRYRKRQNGLRLSDSNGPPGTRGLFLGGAPLFSPGGRRSGDAMTERRSIPFAVPAALASLTGYKRSSQRQSDSSGGERGFERISGRKLPSVLQHGGDGYSDPTGPHDSILSDQSFYRDSHGYYGGPDIPRVAVGSPIRPESGVPVFHPGPARMPVAEAGHFSSSRNLTPPPRRDGLGRSMPSQDGSSRSHGSGSRFTEEI